MNNRIKEIRTDKHLTLDKFGEKIGLKKSAISLIENGKNNVSEHIIVSICREFNVNEQWLRYGTGDKYLPVDRYQEIALLTKDLLHDEPESFKNRFVSMLSHLDIEDWKSLEKMAKLLANIED